MPVIRIDLPEGTPAAAKAAVRDGVKAAVLSTLAPKETKYDYVAVREAFGAIGDGLPLVEIDLRPGREPARKQALVDAIAELLLAEMKQRLGMELAPEEATTASPRVPRRGCHHRR